MSRWRIVLIGASCLTVLASPVPVSASGLTFLHAQAREGGRLCMADHSHKGESNPEPTRAAAIAGAERSWASLTGVEYGREWAHFALAGSRTMACGVTAGYRGPEWICRAEGRPCKVVGGAPQRMRAMPARR